MSLIPQTGRFSLPRLSGRAVRLRNRLARAGLVSHTLPSGARGLRLRTCAFGGGQWHMSLSHEREVAGRHWQLLTLWSWHGKTFALGFDGAPFTGAVQGLIAPWRIDEVPSGVLALALETLLMDSFSSAVSARGGLRLVRAGANTSAVQFGLADKIAVPVSLLRITDKTPQAVTHGAWYGDEAFPLDGLFAELFPETTEMEVPELHLALELQVGSADLSHRELDALSEGDVILIHENESVEAGETRTTERPGSGATSYS